MEGSKKGAKTCYRPGYEYSFPGKIFAVLKEQLYLFIQFIFTAMPFIRDLIYTNFFQPEEQRLPGKISDLLDPKVFSRLSGKKVEKVEYSSRLEQHANSTDRAWFKVKYENEDEEAYVFAKVQAKTFLVRALMSIYGVYRNEIYGYADLDMPIVRPKVHIAKWTPSRFVLALQDLRHDGVTFPNIWETVVDISLAKQVLSSLSKLHAKWWRNAPPGCWNDKNRPIMPNFQGLLTLYNVRRRCPGLISDDMFKVLKLAFWNYDKIRAFLSRSEPQTLVHGDSHMGNFYIRKDGVVGAIDYQVISQEHPMRDVTYFLSCSYPSDKLAEDELHLINYYLEQLQVNGVPKHDIPSFENCWLQYRMQTFYAAYGFIFSGGFSDLMDAHQTTYGVGRIVKLMERIDSAGALYDLLDGKI